jgi:hypothetical protein
VSPRSAFDLVLPAFEHAKAQVWPFHWPQWWRLAIVGILAGELGGFGCGASSPLPGPGTYGSPQLPPFWNPAGAASISVGLAIVLGLLLFALLAVVVVTLTYINSRFRFILIAAVVERQCHGIRAGWRRWRHVGHRFFLWQLAFQFTMLLIVGGVVGGGLAIAAAMGGVSSMRPAVAALILGGVLAFMLLAAIFVTAMVVFVVAKDFMAPILAIEQAGIRAAWRQTWALIAADKLGFAGYIFLKFLLSIAAAMLIGAVMLMLLIPTLGAAVVGGIATAGSISWTPEVMAAVASIGLLFVVWLAGCLALANVPFTVFFPALSLHFLASRYEPLNDWLSSADDAGPVLPTPSA